MKKASDGKTREESKHSIAGKRKVGECMHETLMPCPKEGARL